MVPPCRQGLRGQRGWSHLGGAVNCPNFSRGLTPWPPVLLGVSPSHSAPVQHILLCAHPSVCLSPLLQTPSQFSDPSVRPSPQVTLPCIWRPSTATPSASANCCRYRGWEGLFCPWTPFPPQWWWLARWFLALPGTCSALHHAKKHVCLSVCLSPVLSLRPPAPWTWLTAVAGQHCTTQVSGDGASPVLLVSPWQAACSASVPPRSGQRLHLLLGDPL